MCGAASSLLAAAALAQTPPSLPGSVSPGRIPGQIPLPQSPQLNFPEIVVPPPSQTVPKGAGVNDIVKAPESSTPAAQTSTAH